RIAERSGGGRPCPSSSSGTAGSKEGRGVKIRSRLDQRQALGCDMIAWVPGQRFGQKWPALRHSEANALRHACQERQRGAPPVVVAPDDREIVTPRAQQQGIAQQQEVRAHKRPKTKDQRPKKS